MARQTLPTRVLLACGAAAGPVYVTVTMTHALTRDGSDPRQQRFSWLTTGDLGWIQQSNGEAPAGQGTRSRPAAG